MSVLFIRICSIFALTRVLLLHSDICCMHIRQASQLTARWGTTLTEETDRPVTSVTARAHLAIQASVTRGLS
jgi:hypothetical protein